jgi:glycosyltransferase involved in cell wall biosynthesis
MLSIATIFNTSPLTKIQKYAKVNYQLLNEGNMRIAMIGQKGIPAKYGGVERHVQELSLRLVESGQDITVYSRKWYTNNEMTETDKIHIVHTPSIHTKHLDAITHTFTSTLHAIKHNMDIIHYHGVGPALLSFIPRILSPKTKIITTFHTIDRYQDKWGVFARFILRIGEIAACKLAHQTITISKTLTQYCFDEYKTITEYIPNGVSTAQVSNSITPLKQFNLAKGKYILMVSRLLQKKGAHILIDSFKELKENNKQNKEIQELTLVIVGGSVFTDKYVALLKKQAKNRNDIILTGFQSGKTLEALYTHAKIVVHPSFHEGLPLSVLEAMSYEKPVLVSKIPGHLELISNQECIFDENNTSSLTKAISTFFGFSKEKQKNIAKINKKRVDTHYSWDAIGKKTLSLYTS